MVVCLPLIVGWSGVAPRATGETAAVCAGRNPFTPALSAELASRYPGNRFTAAVHDLRTGCRFTLSPEARQSTASVIKITIMAATLLRAQDADRGLTAWEIAQIAPMISRSDDPSASNLWVSLGGAAGIQAALDRFGLAETTPVEPKWGASLTSAADQIDLITQVLVGPGPLDAERRATAREFLLDVVPEQRWGVTAGVPEGWRVPLKNGFFDSVAWDWRINSVGFVEDPAGSGYAAAVLSDGWPGDQPGIEAVELVSTVIADRLQRTTIPAHDFVDVPEAAYYETAVVWMLANQLTTGVSPLFFGPELAVSRSQMARFLHRLADAPEVTPRAVFDDVPIDAEYASAVTWMVDEGLTTGVTPEMFVPHAALTRAQGAAFLHRLAGSPPAPPAMFEDVPDHAYYAAAVAWMVDAGITVGRSPTTYAPTEQLTRAHIAAFLFRMAGTDQN